MGRLYGFTVSHLLAKDLRFHSFTVVCPGSTVPRFTVVCHGCTVSRLSATVLRFDGFTVVCHGCTVPRLPATVLQFHGFTMLQPSNRGTVEPWGGKGHTTVGRFTVRFDGRRATQIKFRVSHLKSLSSNRSVMRSSLCELQTWPSNTHHDSAGDENGLGHDLSRDESLKITSRVSRHEIMGNTLQHTKFNRFVILLQDKNMITC